MLQDLQKVSLINVGKSWINLEPHNRIHRPLFCFVGAILGFACLLVGSYTRFGLSKQISLALGTIILIKLVESCFPVSHFKPLILACDLFTKFVWYFTATVLLIFSSMKFKIKLRD